MPSAAGIRIIIGITLLHAEQIGVTQANIESKTLTSQSESESDSSPACNGSATPQPETRKNMSRRFSHAYGPLFKLRGETYTQEARGKPACCKPKPVSMPPPGRQSQSSRQIERPCPSDEAEAHCFLSQCHPGHRVIPQLGGQDIGFVTCVMLNACLSFLG